MTDAHEREDDAHEREDDARHRGQGMSSAPPTGGAWKAVLFYIGYTIATMLWGSLSVVVGWAMPYRTRFRFVIVCWTRQVLAWLRLCCGIDAEVQGQENLPTEPCIVFVKHSSTWETLFVQSLFVPQATLVKRELLWIPFFGWAFRLLKPIAIDRQDPRGGLRTLIRDGRARLAAGIWVVLFPEGTRRNGESVGAFQIGGAALAEATGAPVVVVAHDSARYWPAHALRKRAGTIRVRICPPIATTGLKARQINELARMVLMAEMDALRGHTSRLTTESAFDSMNSRLGST